MKWKNSERRERGVLEEGEGDEHRLFSFACFLFHFILRKKRGRLTETPMNVLAGVCVLSVGLVENCCC